MTSKELYKRFLSLCQKWPRDESKSGRDYAEFFRSQLGAYFPKGELSQVKNAEVVEARLIALERIVNNVYFNENQLKKSSASGLEAWACKEAASNESMQIVEERNDNLLLKKLQKSLSIKFVPLARNSKTEA